VVVGGGGDGGCFSPVWNDRKGKNLRGGGAVSHILSKMGGTGNGK
jgi:hypothetical protein